MLLKKFTKYLFPLLLVCLTGCAAVGVVATSNPATKLNDAADLLFRQDRPLPAERLIFEAIQIYQADGDNQGLGWAYRSYAELLSSNAIVSGKESKLYREGNFRDKSITFNNRLEKANEYYLMAIEHFKKAEAPLIKEDKYDALTNIYFNIATSYINLKNKNKGCVYFDKALGAYSENIKRHPTATPYSPIGTVPQRIASLKENAGCPS